VREEGRASHRLAADRVELADAVPDRVRDSSGLPIGLPATLRSLTESGPIARARHSVHRSR
jgi:hypothetical protein